MKKYYYLIGASYRSVNGGLGITSFTIKQDIKGEYTNQKTIDWLNSEAKKVAERNNNIDIESAFVTSISYLGHMTEEEFNG